MFLQNRSLLAAGAFAVLLAATADAASINGVLLTAAQASPQRLRSLKKQGANAVVLSLSNEQSSQERAAAERILKSGLRLYYWVEVGRNNALADEHPEWMASLQGHPEWRRFFPDLRRPGDGEVVKNYPWVPVVYQESFNAHLRRVGKLLKQQPEPSGVFLNDLQSAPSACGCGNSFCRWTPDYGPIKTATRLGDDAAARFVLAVQAFIPKSQIIPVWTTECEEHDQADRCAGVPCYPNTCWKEYSKQLMPLARDVQQLAALVPYKAFDRDQPRYGPTAGWVKSAIRSFAEMPPKREGQAISANRIIAILQGWDVSDEEVKAQIARSAEAGSAGYVVSLTRIEQSWAPRIVTVPKAAASALLHPE